MRSNIIRWSAALLTGALSLGVHAEEAAAPAATDLPIALCESCHGPAGAKPIMPTYPVIAGQYSNYLKHTLEAYRAGTRTNAIMGAQAKTLTDEQIKGLAAHFSAQESPLYTPELPR